MGQIPRWLTQWFSNVTEDPGSLLTLLSLGLASSLERGKMTALDVKSKHTNKL